MKTFIEKEQEQWKIENHNIVHSLSGQCLSVPTAGTSDQITIQRCTSSAYQEWILEDEDWL